MAVNVPSLSDSPLSPKSPSVLSKRGNLTAAPNISILPHLPKYSLIIKKSHTDFLGKSIYSLAACTMNGIEISAPFFYNHTSAILFF